MTEVSRKRKILITGATSGIGLAMVRKLRLEGHDLIMACRNMEKGTKVIEELISYESQGSVSLYEVDLANMSSIKRFAELLASDFSSIDVLINNAGLFSDTKKKTADGFELTVGTNLIGQVLLTELLLPLIKNASRPRIVNISSEAALYGRIKADETFYHKPMKGFPAYAKSKLGQVLYTKHLSESLKGEGIIVNAVHPGHVATNIWQGESLLMKIVGPINMKRYMTPDVAADICIEVALSESYGTISGQLIDVNGPMKLNKKCLDVGLRNDVMILINRVIKDYK